MQKYKLALNINEEVFVMEADHDNTVALKAFHCAEDCPNVVKCVTRFRH